MINRLLSYWRHLKYETGTKEKPEPSVLYQEVAKLQEALQSNFLKLPKDLEKYTDIFPILSGWEAYMKKNLIQAMDIFHSETLGENEWKGWAAIGLARCYLKMGWWQAAKDWCLYALEVSRQQWDEEILFHGYEFLGELFLRSSQPLKALEAFARAEAFEDQFKDYSATLKVSYACTLARLGSISQSQILFEEVFFRDKQSISAQFALLKGLISAHLKDDTIAFEKWYTTIRTYGVNQKIHGDLPYLACIADLLICEHKKPKLFTCSLHSKNLTPVNKYLLFRLQIIKPKFTIRFNFPATLPDYSLNPVDSSFKEAGVPESVIEDISHETNTNALLGWLAV